MNEEIKKKFEKIREIICVSLLVIWLIIPVLKEIRVTCTFVIVHEYTFIKIVGAIGLILLIQEIYIKTKTLEDKKLYDREILPISILGIFMIWTLISSICATNINNAFWGNEYRKEGYITYLAYAGFFSLAFFIKLNMNKKVLINTFVVIAILNILVVKLYNLGIGMNILAARNIKNTCFFNTNHYGYYLMLATVTANFLFVTEKNRIVKIIYLLAYSYLLYYIILNNTFGCYLAIAFVLIIFIGYTIYHKEKRVVALISILIFLLMSFANYQIRTIIQRNIASLFKDVNNIVVVEQIEDTDTELEVKEKKKVIAIAETGGSGRIKLWKQGVSFFLEKPILGYGPENLEDKYLKVGIEEDRPHNLLIQLATTSGIIGLILYITAIGIILIRGLKNLKLKNDIHIIVFANIIVYLVSAMFGNSMYYTSPYFFIFLGFLMYENIIQKRKIDSIKEKN